MKVQTVYSLKFQDTMIECPWQRGYMTEIYAPTMHEAMKIVANQMKCYGPYMKAVRYIKTDSKKGDMSFEMKVDGKIK